MRSKMEYNRFKGYQILIAIVYQFYGCSIKSFEDHYEQDPSDFEKWTLIKKNWLEAIENSSTGNENKLPLLLSYFKILPTFLPSRVALMREQAACIEIYLVFHFSNIDKDGELLNESWKLLQDTDGGLIAGVLSKGAEYLNKIRQYESKIIELEKQISELLKKS